jgi:hypothetical protein
MKDKLGPRGYRYDAPNQVHHPSMQDKKLSISFFATS